MRRDERTALELLERAGITKPPVPVELLANLLNASVLYEQLDPEVSGALYRLERGTVIAVNKSHAGTRQRFTLAHECGHLSLHAGRPLIVDHIVRARVNLRDHRSSLATDREEIEANSFAANLLMPAELIHHELPRVLRRADDEQVVVLRLARTFDVSPQAMEYRLTNLGMRSTLP